MHVKILIFTVQGVTAIGSLMHALTQFIPPFDGGNVHMTLQNITIDDIRRGILAAQKEPCLFILPGIMGQDSPYQHIFEKDDLEKLSQFVARRNVFLGICAGAFFVSERTLFVPPWQGSPKFLRSLNPLFNGVADGPLPAYATRDGLNVVSVHVTEWNKEISLPYSMGPAFFPVDKNDPGLEIMATYTQIQPPAAAALRQAFGLGAAYLSGPHPEMAITPISNHYQGATLDKIRAISEILKPHESERGAFWNYMLHRIMQDLKP